jgi:hypothetical protein
MILTGNLKVTSIVYMYDRRKILDMFRFICDDRWAKILMFKRLDITYSNAISKFYMTCQFRYNSYCGLLKEYHLPDCCRMFHV